MCDVCADVRPFAQSCDFEFSLSQEITEGVDAANGIGTTYTMQPGDTWNGLIDSGGDRDWIAVELIEGHVYELNVKGAPSGVGTLTDPITAIYDLNGIYLDTDDDGGYGAEAQLTWTATYSGTHYVMGRGYSAATGTYQLTLVDTSAPVIEEPYSGTVDQMATYLTNGYWSDTGSSAHRFNTAVSNQIAVDLDGLTEAGKQLARWAMEAWEAVADLEFIEDPGNAKISFDDAASGASANASWTGAYTNSATVNVATGWISSYGDEIGSYTFQTYMHEIGHALGLGHQGDYNGGATYGTDNTFIEDSWQLSVMSYFDQNENTAISASKAHTVTAQLVDIVAIQALYGAAGAGSLSDGDTVYGVGHTLGASWLGQMWDAINGTGPTSVFDFGRIAFTVWDRGGRDVIDFSNESAAQTVDLRAEAISSVGGSSNNMLIARDTVIEEFRAGSGNDHVQGNSADNVLIGNGGTDTLIGDAGDDILQGGAGGDTLNGGEGIDTADYSNASAGVRVDMLNASTNWGDAAGDILIGIENLTGTQVRDVLRGDNDGNEFHGLNGRDVMDGKAGADRLFGENGFDKLTGSAGDDLLRGGGGNDQLFGGNHDDRLFGDNGSDTLNGQAGNDILVGGSGVDTFIYTEGKDEIVDFGNDLLRIDDAVWGGAAKTAAEVLDFADMLGNHAVFNFGGGNTLTLRNFSDIAGLESVLTIF